MDQNSLFTNDFKSVELCKQMQKKCSIESTGRPVEIDYYDDDSIENEICSVDEYDEPKQDNDSSGSSHLSMSGFKTCETHPLTELNPFLVKNKQRTNELALNGGPLTPTGKASSAWAQSSCIMTPFNDCDTQ